MESGRNDAKGASTKESDNSLSQIAIECSVISDELVKYLDEVEHVNIHNLEDHKLDHDIISRIWTVSDDFSNSNILIGNKKKEKMDEEILNFVIQEFKSFVNKSPISGFPIRGIAFNITELNISQDYLNTPSLLENFMNNVFKEAYLQLETQLYEAIYSVIIYTESSKYGKLCSYLHEVGFDYIDEQKCPEDYMTKIIGNLPASKSIGFSSKISALTNRTSSVKYVFQEWKRTSDPDPSDS